MSPEPVVRQFAGERYSISALMARGGMADIYRARDRTTEQTVVIKRVSAEHQDDEAYRLRLSREAEALARIQHPHVVRLIDADLTTRRVPYLVLEALDGENLHQCIERSGAMALGRAVPLIAQLGGALGAAHRAGIVHGDVKPQNVLLCGALNAPSRVVLIDFGCAQPIGSCRCDDTVAGTPEYMAPEQILGDPVDQRTDIYSFGVVLFRWLTGTLPFRAGTTLETVMHQLLKAAPRPSSVIGGLPSRLDQVLLTALRKQPEQRYSNMAALLADLSCACTGVGTMCAGPSVCASEAYRPRTTQGQRAWGLLNPTSM